MERIDKVIFGDNQFFGINHMSQEKAQQLSEKFHDIKNIYKDSDDIERGLGLSLYFFRLDQEDLS